MSTNSKEYGKAWYEANKTKRIAQIQADKIKKRDYVREHKESRGCMDCSGKFPYYMLDLDHRPDEEKTADVSFLVKKGAGLKRIKEEIAKCDVVCKNCHAQRTHDRGYKGWDWG